MTLAEKMIKKIESDGFGILEILAGGGKHKFAIRPGGSNSFEKPIKPDKKFRKELFSYMVEKYPDEANEESLMVAWNEIHQYLGRSDSLTYRAK